MPTSGAKRKPDLTETVQEFLETKAEAKRLYDKADKILVKLVRPMRKAGGEIPWGEKHKAVLKNNWKGKFVVWGHGRMRHYDIEVINN
jgi:hypothetical protein